MSDTLYDFTWDRDCLQGVWCDLGGEEACVEALLFRPGSPGGGDWFDEAECLGVYMLASDIRLSPGDCLVIDGLEHDGPVYGSEAQEGLSRLQEIERLGVHIPSQQHLDDQERHEQQRLANTQTQETA